MLEQGCTWAPTLPRRARRWMAPEVIEHNPYKEKADVFSFGIVLWEVRAQLTALMTGCLHALQAPGSLPHACLGPHTPLPLTLRPAVAHRAHPLQRHDAAAGRCGRGAEGSAPAHPPQLPAAAVGHHAPVLAARPQRAAVL